MMVEIKRLIIVALATFACVGMWGCSDDDYRRWGGRYEGSLVAIIDDSLALLTNSRGYEDCHDVFMGSEECERGGTNDGLFLVNYRKQQNPYWGDTVDGEINLIGGYYNDSSAFFLNAKNEFGFWRIGGKPRVFGKWNCEAPCRCDWRKYGRPWIDGNVLLKMENQNECPYAVLDVTMGIVKRMEFTGDYAWLKGCNDITYIDGEVVCLRQRGNEYCEINFEKNGIVIDSIMKPEWMMGYPPEIYGNVAKMKVKSFDKKDHAYDFGERLSLIEKSGFLFENYPETWLKDNSFVDSTGSLISYYPSEDLIVTK